MAANFDWTTKDTVFAVATGAAIVTAAVGIGVAVSAKKEVRQVAADVADLSAWQAACIQTGDITVPAATGNRRGFRCGG
jgi:hypothetical protein